MLHRSNLRMKWIIVKMKNKLLWWKLTYSFKYFDLNWVRLDIYHMTKKFKKFLVSKGCQDNSLKMSKTPIFRGFFCHPWVAQNFLNIFSYGNYLVYPNWGQSIWMNKLIFITGAFFLFWLLFTTYAKWIYEANLKTASWYSWLDLKKNLNPVLRPLDTYL